MKNKLFLLFFTFSLIINAQKEKGTVTLIDGTAIDGFVKVTSNKIIFKSDKNAKADKYDFTQAKSAIIVDKKGNEAMFEFVKINEDKDPKLLSIIVDGYLRLYSESITMYFGQPSASNPGGGFSGSSTYYIKKTNEEIAQYYVAYGYIPKVSFEKVIESYFSDCPKIQTKVENKEFKKKNYKEIVEYYNQNCALKN